MNKKDCVKRSVEFWGKTAEKQLGFVLGFVVVFYLNYKFIIAGDGIFNSLKVNLLFYSLIEVFVYTMMNIYKDVNYILSFGSLRKEAFFGLQFLIIISIIQYDLIYVLLDQFVDKSSIAMLSLTDVLFMLTGGLFLVTGIGQLIGVVVMNFKGIVKNVAVTLIIVVIVAGFIAGIVDFSNAGLLSTLVDIKYFLGLAGLAVYIIGSVVNYFNILKISVKQG